MLTGSDLTNWFASEADYLCFDGQVSVNKGFPVSGQGLSLADKGKRTTQVLGKPVRGRNDCYFSNSKLKQKAISPNPTVCTLLPGQYLPCGIGVSEFQAMRFDLTSVDVRRWELCASVIGEISNTTSPSNKHDPADRVKIDDLYAILDGHKLDIAFAIHVPNFSTEGIDGALDKYDDLSPLKQTGILLLYLLRFFIPLTAAYGGTHLSAWNFEFPSRIESIIWRTACLIIMGSSFALLGAPSLESLYRFHPRPTRSIDLKRRRRLNFIMPTWYGRTLMKRISYIFAGLLLLCYAASRIYLVLESFISLRHVPIGVYAAVPWVQNIPHV